MPAASVIQKEFGQRAVNGLVADLTFGVVYFSLRSDALVQNELKDCLQDNKLRAFTKVNRLS